MPTAPTKVQNLTASFGSSTIYDTDTRMHSLILTVSWSTPQYTNGEILYYEVILTQTADSSNVVYSMNVTELEVMQAVSVLPYTDYTVSVAASTSAGQGEKNTDIILSPQAGENSNILVVIQFSIASSIYVAVMYVA